MYLRADSPSRSFQPHEPHRPRQMHGFSLLETLFVMAISVVIAGIAAPMAGNLVGNFRLSGDARSIWNAVSQAKLRAASDFTKARVFVDLNANAFHIEIWQKTGTPGWVTEGGVTFLNSADALGFGVVAAPPPHTQPATPQAPTSLDSNHNPTYKLAGSNRPGTGLS